MERQSEIRIERGLLQRAGEIIAQALPGKTCAIVSDDVVDALYGDALEASLRGAGLRVARMAFAHGEASKNIHTYFEVINFLAEHRLTRKDAVVALGGGVVGDLAGFAAATYLRGVNLVQVPTSLLACVDSSVGGKTAIDLPAGKNLCGAFYQPDLVLIDPELLRTLPEEIFIDGMAEVVKYAAIWDWSILQLCGEARANAGEIIRRCVEIKRQVVEQDERDNAIRQILNFGHTFGHAVEAISGFQVSHGRAVAIGMAAMARACAGRGMCEAQCARELIAALDALGIPTTTPYRAEELFDAMLSDKKRLPDGLTLVLLRGRGQCELRKVPLEEAKELLKEGLQA